MLLYPIIIALVQICHGTPKFAYWFSNEWTSSSVLTDRYDAYTPCTQTSTLPFAKQRQPLTCASIAAGNPSAAGASYHTCDTRSMSSISLTTRIGFVQKGICSYREYSLVYPGGPVVPLIPLRPFVPLYPYKSAAPQ